MKTKHNLSNHRLYNIWANMKNRCNNKESKNYKNYGGRGISVCDEWINNFILFYNWSLENGYKNDLTIDRINHFGNYEPSNCRWVNREVQNQNTRKLYSHNTSGYRGVYFNKKSNSWKSQISIDGKQRSLGYFNTALDGALAYDNYITEHNLQHTKNF